MSLGSNKNTSVKRLSALAQLIQLYAEQGVTSTPELSERTGYSERAIRKAKAEPGCRHRGAARNQGAARKPGAASPGTRVPPPAVGTLVAQEVNNITNSSKTPNHTRVTRESPARSNFFPDEEPIHSLPANFLKPTDTTDPPAWRGSVLVVTAEQHRTWKRMFPGFDLKAGYAIADAECAEKGKLNGSAVIHTQKKLGYLVQDMQVAMTKGLSPDEIKDRKLEAILRAENPGFMGRG